MVQDVYYAKENPAAKAPSEDQKRLPAVCKSIGQKAWGTKELTQRTEDLSKDAKDAITMTAAGPSSTTTSQKSAGAAPGG